MLVDIVLSHTFRLSICSLFFFFCVCSSCESDFILLNQTNQVLYAYITNVLLSTYRTPYQEIKHKLET